MNIREYKRSLMVVKNIDSEFISEAFFVLKSGAEEENEAKISAEAERIIRECGECKKKRRTLSAAFIFVFACLGALAIICLCAILIAQFTV